MLTIYENFDLQAYNTFGVLARCKYFANVCNVQALQLFLRKQKHASLPMLLLGGGSNILFTQFYTGIVLHNAIKGIVKVKENEEYVWIKAFGGEQWHDLVQYCTKKGWGGIENLSLIPGSVGAAPVQNIGAYGVELKDVLHEVEAIELSSGEKHNFSNAACAFAYRNSIFKQALKGKYFITAIVLQLRKQAQYHIEYGAIKKVLATRQIAHKNLSPAIVSDVITHIREGKLPNPKILGNSGSFFKNPIVKNQAFKLLQAKYPNIPHYIVDGEHTKIPAAWLIEQCGYKGKRVGDAGTYKKHALVLVNYGNATGNDLWKFAQDIKGAVQKKFGITLQAEVNIV